MASKPIPYRTLLLAIFALSGFAGLIYQSIWTHYLGLFLGHAAYAQALVLSLFMGGMALGASLVSRYGTQWRNLIKAYALAEAVIGLFAIGFHPLFVNFLALSYDAILPALPGSTAISAYKWGAAGLLILPQTILLGMTFPLLSGGLIRRIPGEDGQNLGSLYFANSIGAAAGVLVATFAFLPLMGLPGAMLTGGLLNLVVAAAAWRLGRDEPPTPQPQPINAPDSGFSRSPLVRAVLLATFFSSAASFAYELLFVRMLSLAVGSTLHSFELMIAAFVLGIALGARWIRRRAGNTESPLKLAGNLQIWMGISALVGLALYSQAFAWVGFLMDALGKTSGGYALFNVGTGITAIAIMLPTAFFAGTTLPVYTVALLRAGHGEAAIGRVYAWNTLGAIVGVTATIHWLMPTLGLKVAMLVAALVDIGIGVALFRFGVRKRIDFLRVGAGVTILFGAALVTVWLIALDPMKLSSGVYRSGNARLPDDIDIQFYKDGKTATVTILQNPGGKVSIATNGKVDAGVQMDPYARPAADEATMALLGALPLAYKPDASNAAVIGMGSGITTHTLLGYPDLEHVDTIEIEQAMVEAARRFGIRSERAFYDPRSNLIIDDAKSYFSSSRKRYDLIVSEPSNPWMSGVGNLFSEEFYATIPRVLHRDGVFVQWLQLYEIDNRLVNSALGALLPRFDYVQAYLANGADLILVASNEPLSEPDFDSLIDSRAGTDLRRAGIADPRQIGYRRVADRGLLRAITKLHPAPVNSDYFPILSLEAPQTRFRGLHANWITDLALLETGLLEWLALRTPVADPAWPKDTSHFPGESAAANALALRDWILANRDESALGTLKPANRALALRIQAAGEIMCRDNPPKADLEFALETLAQLSEKLLPHLGRNLLDGVLVAPVWLQCQAPAPAVRHALEILESMARRDSGSMAVSARQWLEGRDQRPDYAKPFDPVAFTALQFGLIGQNRYGEAAAVEQQYGEQVPAKDSYAITRTLLAAWLENLD